jgi:hypothetical protein
MTALRGRFLFGTLGGWGKNLGEQGGYDLHFLAVAQVIVFAFRHYPLERSCSGDGVANTLLYRACHVLMPFDREVFRELPLRGLRFAECG